MALRPLGEKESESWKVSVQEEAEVNGIMKVVYYCGVHATYDLDATAGGDITEDTSCKGFESATVLLVEPTNPLRVSGMFHCVHPFHYNIFIF